MKKAFHIFMAALLLLFPACNRPSQGQEPVVGVDGIPEIKVSSPTPTRAIEAVHLSAGQEACVEAGNKLAFKFLHQLRKTRPGNLVCSPLSLQYALGMTANGASGETLSELLAAMGYGPNDLEKLNAFCHLLLDELPAVDLDVALKLTDAMLVSQQYPLQRSFKQTIESLYYAAVENMPFDNPDAVAKRINDWASFNTNGLIDKLMQPGDISPDMVAALMNALYFKAKWAGSRDEPMFDPESTYEENFYQGGCTVLSAKMMHTRRVFPYAQMDGYQVVALPYAGGKFFFYVLLPNDVAVGDLPEDSQPKADYFDFDMLCQRLPELDWGAITSALTSEYGIRLSLPAFDIESTFDLTEDLQAMGVKRAFANAEFPRMFDVSGDFQVGKVIQKAKISLAEWGTEAAAVTVVTMEKNAGPGELKWIDFNCNHPFIYVIGERTSGTILFTGVYQGA